MSTTTHVCPVDAPGKPPGEGDPGRERRPSLGDPAPRLLERWTGGQGEAPRDRYFPFRWGIGAGNRRLGPLPGLDDIESAAP